MTGYRRFSRSGESNASGSPHRIRLDENPHPCALANIDEGLAIDRLRRDDGPAPANLTLDSKDSGKNPRRRRNGDFTDDTPRYDRNEKTLEARDADDDPPPNGDGHRLLQKLRCRYRHGDAVEASRTIRSAARLRSNPNE